MSEELTQEKFEQQEGELLPGREAPSVIGPLPPVAGTDAVLPQIAGAEAPDAG